MKNPAVFPLKNGVRRVLPPPERRLFLKGGKNAPLFLPVYLLTYSMTDSGSSSAAAEMSRQMFALAVSLSAFSFAASVSTSPTPLPVIFSVESTKMSVTS